MTGRGVVPFVSFFPEQAMAETRVFITRGHLALPDDEYGLFEAYCDDPQCTCRRVMLNVAGRAQQAVLASISYAFDRDDELAGPFLDPLNPQSPYADALLELVEQILEDPVYLARLEAHYLQVKGLAADPGWHAQQRRAARTERRQARAPRPARKRRKRRSR
jgi:hypothetical protein